MELYPIRLGITIGLLWSIVILILSFMREFKYSKMMINFISKLYPKCNYNNIYICMVSGFIDGFIWGILIGVIYNNLPINH